MKSQLFIPEKVRVGFQKREDTYTKKLAYVIYYGPDGKLRKETSWKGWCQIPGEKRKWTNTVCENDSEVDLTPFDIENKPHSGFVLNKGVQRYGYWGSGRNMVRVYDDRGVEFEISVNNLMFILMTTNCHKRGLEGEFVYAWTKGDLILLPVGCEEYKESTVFTGMQDKKVSAKEVVPGCAYTTKQQKKLIYIGKFDWYGKVSKSKWRRGYDSSGPSKRHIFVEEGAAKDEYVVLSGFTSIATRDTDAPVSNYAEIMEEFSKTTYSSAPKEIKSIAKEIVLPENKDTWGGTVASFYLKNGDESYDSCTLYSEWKWNNMYPKDNQREFVGYWINRDYTYSVKNGKFEKNYRYSRSQSDKKYLTENQVNSLNSLDILLILDSEREVEINRY